MPLPGRLRAADDDERIALHLQLDAFARRADRRFDVAGDANAARPGRFAPALAEAGVVGHPQRARQVTGKVPRVEDQAHRRAIWQLALGDHIAPADLRAIDAEAARRHVEQALEDMVRFRSPGAAVRHRRHRVRCEGLQAQRHCRHAIDGGQDRAEIRERHERHGVRADIAARMYVIGNDASIGVAAERRADRGIAALEIADKGFAPRRAPAHRAADPADDVHPPGQDTVRVLGRRAVQS